VGAREEREKMKEWLLREEEENAGKKRREQGTRTKAAKIGNIEEEEPIKPWRRRLKKRETGCERRKRIHSPHGVRGRVRCRTQVGSKKGAKTRRKKKEKTRS